ncbi:CRE-SRE-45 protein [Caenorhabditis remanei]|uniref:CRE-SRE-45 protein n=1 Tax=Caenorhabditis remanei TaxID=31234 RepID=E3MMU8_CAERE|nr:CRE-SRE-45 protein [Caenorhabditis remanei]
MIFLIGNNTRNYSVCYPIFIIEDNRSLEFPFSMLLFFELFLTFVSFYFVIKGVYVAARIRSFHRNLTALLIIYLLQWFEGLISNLLIKPYEIGYWPLGEYSEPIKQWWTDDQSRMTKLTDMRESPYFFIGGFIKWHYILSLITTLLFVSIERSFACYFLNDYEKKSRNLFFFLLIFGQFSMNMVAAFLFFFNAAHFAVGLAYILSANLIAMGIFSYVKNVNNQVTKAIEDFSNPSVYCLPARFQARENMRCFQMISRVIIAALCIIFTGCFVNLIMYLEFTPSIDPLLNLIFECAINLNPVIICPTLMGSVDAWRKFSFSNGFCKRIQMKMRRRRVTKVSSTDGGCSSKHDKTKKETDAYFDQLNSAWI